MWTTRLVLLVSQAGHEPTFKLLHAFWHIDWNCGLESIYGLRWGARRQSGFFWMSNSGILNVTQYSTSHLARRQDTRGAQGTRIHPSSDNDRPVSPSSLNQCTRPIMIPWQITCTLWSLFPDDQNFIYRDGLNRSSVHLRSRMFYIKSCDLILCLHCSELIFIGRGWGDLETWCRITVYTGDEPGKVRFLQSV
jgi:hypothetical protein